MLPVPLFAKISMQSLGLDGSNWRRVWRRRVSRAREEQQLRLKACSGGLSSTSRMHLTKVLVLGILGCDYGNDDAGVKQSTAALKLVLVEEES